MDHFIVENMTVPNLTAGALLSPIQIQTMNDVHGRWLPVHETRGGLCLPENDNATFNDYIEQCVTDQTVSGRLRAIKAFESMYDSTSNSGADVIRVIVGDEFQGTPLFSIPKEQSQTDYGYALKDLENLFSVGTTDATPESNKIPPGKLHTYMAIGNHEFDLGIPSLIGYYTEVKKLKNAPKILCWNCDFKGTGCEGIPYLPKDVWADKTLVIGLTPDNLPSLTNTAQDCKVNQCPDMWQQLQEDTDFKAASRVIVLSHMGVHEDVNCIKSWATNLKPAEYKKIQYWAGSHSHTVPCGNGTQEYYAYVNKVQQFNLTHNTEKVDDVDVTCNITVAGENTYGNQNYSQIKNGKHVFNYPLVFPGSDEHQVKLGHNGMFGLILNKIDLTDKVVMALKPVTSLYDSKSVEEKKQDYAGWKDAINNMIKLNSQALGYANSTIDGGSCHQGMNNRLLGCDAGVWFSHANLSFALNNYLNTPEYIAKMPYGTPFASFWNGGGIRADITPKKTSHIVSWAQINTAFPFFNRSYTVKVSGENLIRNLNYGMWELGGIQLAGIRLQVKRDFDPEAYHKNQAGKKFCKKTDQSVYDDRKTGLQKDSRTMDELTGDLNVHASKVKAMEAMKEDKRNLTASQDGHVSSVDPSTFVKSKIGCRENMSDDPVWEISTMLIEYYREIAKGVAANNYYMTPDYMNCENWEAIDPKKEYYISTNDFIHSGGDGYCVEPTETVKQEEKNVGMTPMAMEYLQNVDGWLRKLDDNWIVNSYSRSSVAESIADSVMLLVLVNLLW